MFFSEKNRWKNREKKLRETFLIYFIGKKLSGWIVVKSNIRCPAGYPVQKPGYRILKISTILPDPTNDIISLFFFLFPLFIVLLLSLGKTLLTICPFFPIISSLSLNFYGVKIGLGRLVILTIRPDSWYFVNRISVIRPNSVFFTEKKIAGKNREKKTFLY